MKITTSQVKLALQLAIDEQERQLARLIERENWREAGDKAAYLDGLRFAVDLVAMLQIKED